MATENSESPEAVEICREIDACCQAFENAWKNGHAPAMEQFVVGVRLSGRTKIIRELLVLELNYRRNGNGAPLTESEICELHPGLMPEIAEQAELIRSRPSNDSGDEWMTQGPAPSDAQHENTIEHVSKKSQKSQGSRSRGLHIRFASRFSGIPWFWQRLQVEVFSATNRRARAEKWVERFLSRCVRGKL